MSDSSGLRALVVSRTFVSRSQHGFTAKDASPQDAVERQRVGRSTAGTRIVRSLDTIEVQACRTPESGPSDEGKDNGQAAHPAVVELVGQRLPAKNRTRSDGDAIAAGFLFPASCFRGRVRPRCRHRLRGRRGGVRRA